MTAIVLAGHGSSVSTETGGLVRRAADLLREWGVADEVATAFWKEPPSYTSVADSLVSQKIIVVPVFAARGFFVDTVLPRELAKGRKDVEYVITPPIGEHPRMAELVVEAAKRALSVRDGSFAYVAGAQGSQRNTAVIVVGHGTPKHRGSRDTTFAIVERLRGENVADKVEAAFLDDEPRIADAIGRCRGSRVVAVANFIAKGSHVEDDVPEAICQALNGPDFAYVTPDLTGEEVARMAWELIGDVVSDS